jgi:GMP synthase (glutamine-hydrolysing)
MRENEGKQVGEALKRLGIEVKIIDAHKRFFQKLKGIVEPEEKRKIIGNEFIKVFEDFEKGENAKFLIQGTIGPDWIESGGEGRDTIKSHHNVGGLPKEMKLKLCEPLRDLYKH